MSKDKGNKNNKKAKATNKKKVVSDYKAKGHKNQPVTDVVVPKSGSKTSGDNKKKP